VRALYPQVQATAPDCVSIILSTDEIGAKAARASVDAGADFASVASQVSIEAQSAPQGGFLGCASPAQIQQKLTIDVSSLKAGAVVGPVEIPQQGFVVLRLDSTTGPTFAQARPQIEQELNTQGVPPALLGARLAKLLVGADVQVDTRYGQWNPKAGIVDPPAGPLTTTTTVAVPTPPPAAPPVSGGNP
jgi:parvulin-like peptidyl-prolyl isomerase